MRGYGSDELRRRPSPTSTTTGTPTSPTVEATVAAPRRAGRRGAGARAGRRHRPAGPAPGGDRARGARHRRQPGHGRPAPGQGRRRPGSGTSRPARRHGTRPPGRAVPPGVRGRTTPSSTCDRPDAQEACFRAVAARLVAGRPLRGRGLRPRRPAPLGYLGRRPRRSPSTASCSRWRAPTPATQAADGQFVELAEAAASASDRGRSAGDDRRSSTPWPRAAGLVARAPWCGLARRSLRHRRATTTSLSTSCRRHGPAPL